MEKKLSLIHIERFSLLGPIGVYIYVVGFSIPFNPDIPLMVLVITSILAVTFGSHDTSDTSTISRLPSIAVALFLVSVGLSLFVSEDMERSLRLSASFLPALLLFFLIRSYFNRGRDLRFLYFSFSLVGLMLAAVSLWVAWENNFYFDNHHSANVLVSWSPILVSRNDLTFLSIIAPFSLALVYRNPRSAVGFFAALSIVLSVCAVVAFQSRGATLTIVVAIASTAAFLRPRLALMFGLAAFALVFIIDALLGFPLVERFISLLEHPVPGRIKQWEIAWTMFLDAPLLGHGLHTFALFHKTPWPHNLYLEILSGQGMVGFISVMFLLLYGISAAWNTRNAALKDIRFLGAGVFGGMIGFILSGTFELSFLRQWVVIMLFVLLGVITRLYTAQKMEG